jgi:predicted signal transduction protein with EAL and GGDEF domain
MTIVAEGVETTAQETFLRDHACDEMQGYLLSKPILPDQMALLLRPLHLSPPLQPASDADSEPPVARATLTKSAV